MTDGNRQHIVCFDILRVISTLAVAVLHLSAQHWADIDITSRAWFAFNLYDSAVRWCVPIFVMISGALFLGRDIPLSVLLKKNILRLAAAFVFWSGLYALRGYLVYDTTPAQTRLAFVQGHYHMWFLLMIIGLYLIVPLLRHIARSETATLCFLLSALVIAFLLPQCASLSGHPVGDVISAINDALGYTAYFVSGFYLSGKKLGRRAERVFYALGIAGFFFTVFASRAFSLAQSRADTQFYSYHTLNVLFMAVAVFVFGKQHLNFPRMSEKAVGVLRRLSKYSFGSYLVHAMIIEILNDRFALSTLSLNAFFSVPLLALLVFVISMALSALLNQIPIVKKYLV